LREKQNLGGTIYVVRLMNNPKYKSPLFDYTLGISKPCTRCHSFLKYHGIKKVKYTDIIDDVNVLVEMRL